MEVAPKPIINQLLDRTYFGPVFPEPPEFRDPNQDLGKIGVREVKVIPGPRWIDPTGKPVK
jgi:hypothetical protein